MCGRYRIVEEPGAEELAKIIAEINRRYKGTETLARMKLGEVAPTDVVPVIANSRSMNAKPFLMKWGFQAGEDIGLVINARCETAAGKAMFRDGMARRRCLIPAANYYEWQKRPDGKHKFSISTEEKVLYMAGLYRLEGDGKVPSFVILTRPAADEISFVHDRMPVIIPRERAEEWLGPGTEVPDPMELASEDVFFTRA